MVLRSMDRRFHDEYSCDVIGVAGYGFRESSRHQSRLRTTKLFCVAPLDLANLASGKLSNVSRLDLHARNPVVIADDAD